LFCLFGLFLCTFGSISLESDDIVVAEATKDEESYYGVVLGLQGSEAQAKAVQNCKTTANIQAFRNTAAGMFIYLKQAECKSSSFAGLKDFCIQATQQFQAWYTECVTPESSGLDSFAKKVTTTFAWTSRLNTVANNHGDLESLTGETWDEDDYQFQGEIAGSTFYLLGTAYNFTISIFTLFIFLIFLL
jgi:hypothetical protein